MNLYDLWLIKSGRVPLTQHQERRRGLLTSGDAAILLGVDPWPYRPPAEILADEAVQLGRLLERPILRWGARRCGQRIVCNQFRVSEHAGLKLGAQHDALSLSDPSQGFEAKTAGLRGPFLASELWGEEGTDQVPPWILAQTQWQAIVSGLAVVWVPALLGGRGHRLYRIDANKDLRDILLEKAHEFWEQYVRRDTPPPSAPPGLDLARMMHRTKGKTVRIDGWKTAAAWRELDAAAKAAEKAADQAKAAMLAEAGDAEEVETETGKLSIKRVSVERLDSQALRAALPDVAAKYVKSTEQVRVVWKATKTEADNERA
jgi:predicted phage-related endonuclease